MMEPLVETETKKIDGRIGKNKSKYQVGQILSNKMENERCSVYKVISVRKDPKSKKTLYTIFNINTGKVFKDLDSQRVNEVVNKLKRVSRKTTVSFLNRDVNITEVEKILGCKKDSLIKLLNRRIYSFNEMREFIKKKENEYLQKNRLGEN